MTVDAVQVVVDGQAAESWAHDEVAAMWKELRGESILSEDRRVLRARFYIPASTTGSLSATAEKYFRDAAEGVKADVEVHFKDGTGLNVPENA